MIGFRSSDEDLTALEAAAAVLSEAAQVRARAGAMAAAVARRLVARKRCRCCIEARIRAAVRAVVRAEWLERIADHLTKGIPVA